MPNRQMNAKFAKENVRKAKYVQDVTFQEGLSSLASKAHIRETIVKWSDGVTIQRIETGRRTVKPTPRVNQIQVKFHPPIRSAGRVS